MTTQAADPESPRRRAQALLAAALLAVTAFVRVPIQLYDASRQDFAGGSGDVLLILLGAGAVLFLVVALGVAWLPSRLRNVADAALVGLAVYAWARAGLFPGPSVNLDGGRVTTDLSTGLAGLLVPLAGGLLLAWLGGRQPRIATTVLAVLLGGSVVQSVAAAASSWRPGAPASETAVATLLEWSREENVLIVVLDTLQSRVFEEVLEAEPGLRKRLDGFRFYRSASSNSPTTYLSLPAIHSGRRYDPARSAREFYHESILEGSVLNRLADHGYRVSYAMAMGPCPSAVASCLGTLALGRSRGEIAIKEASHLLDLGTYRALPDGLRRSILERGRGPLEAMVGQIYQNGRAESELAALERVASSSVVRDSPPTAKMIHTVITHPPSVLLSDCSTGERRLDRQSAVAQARCAFRPIVALLDRLEAEGAYDVSNILLIADHGAGFGRPMESRDRRFKRMVGALSPVVLVKPAHERGPLSTSDAPIELPDLARALCDETGCSPSDGLRSLGSVDAGRVRQALWYNWKNGYWNLPQIPNIVLYSIRGDMAEAASWSREASAYTPGTVLDFRSKKQNSAAYLGVGWGRRTPTHQPMVDPRATLQLRMPPDPALDYQMVLRAQWVTTSATAARVAVQLNGVKVGEVVSNLPGPPIEEHELSIPATVLSRSPDTTITFSTEEPLQGEGRARFGLQTFELRRRP